MQLNISGLISKMGKLRNDFFATYDTELLRETNGTMFVRSTGKTWMAFLFLAPQSTEVRMFCEPATEAQFELLSQNDRLYRIAVESMSGNPVGEITMKEYGQRAEFFELNDGRRRAYLQTSGGDIILVSSRSV